MLFLLAVFSAICIFNACQRNHQIPFLPARYSAYPMAANIIPRNPMIGRVAVLGIEKRAVPHAYRKIDMTSKTTNIRM